jgi:hypothetical protein
LPPLSIGLLPPSPDYAFLSSTQYIFNLDGISAISSVYSYDPASHALVYKPVAQMVRPVIAPFDEEFRITHTFLTIRLLDLVLYLHIPWILYLGNVLPRNVLTAWI